MSSARNAGESAICPVRVQPSAEIVRVECAKCRRECDLPEVHRIIVRILKVIESFRVVIQVEKFSSWGFSSWPVSAGLYAEWRS